MTGEEVFFEVKGTLGLITLNRAKSPKCTYFINGKRNPSAIKKMGK